MQFKKGLFIFRRDLRLDDNTGLIRALKECEAVIPAFIADPRQLERNAYRSDNCVQFMVESLEDLEGQLKGKGGKLFLFSGKAEEVVAKLIKKEKVDIVYVNRDYTPFSKKRDSAIAKVCTKAKIPFAVHNDVLLIEPEDALKGNGEPYRVFTPFFKNAKKKKVREPVQSRAKNYFKGAIKGQAKGIYKKMLKKRNKNLHVNGGRKKALKILKSLDKFDDYKDTHDFPSKDTTYLSAHNKFGTVSIREVYHAIKSKLSAFHPLLRQLYWRDFFTHVAFHFPRVFGESFHKKYDRIKWKNDKKVFKAWCDGKTGFPIVDAGMRQLNETGFMHNRVRMIVGSFLTKDLHIDWRWGEKYFAQKLVDYDPSVNNGNWQWVASTGCDAQPYFRIFNLWSQQKKFDKKCKYIKEWVPELAEVEPSVIHALETEKVEGYPPPLVDHDKERKVALAAYKKV